MEPDSRPSFEESSVPGHQEVEPHREPAEISQWKFMLLLACGGLLTNLCIGALLLKQNQNFTVQEKQRTDAISKNRQFLEEVNVPMDQMVRELVSLNPPGIREIFTKYGLAGPLALLPNVEVKSLPKDQTQHLPATKSGSGKKSK
jgi:hypothetical protein